MDYKMQLTPEEVAILNGNEGETKAKILKTDSTPQNSYLPSRNFTKSTSKTQNKKI